MLDYVKHPDQWEWQPYFSIQEFTCHESGECLMDANFMQMLFQLRAEFAKPMKISSGYRSPAHNMQVSETGASGPHTHGKAADISIRGKDALMLIGLAIQHGFMGIGISQKGDGRFVHLDLMTEAEGFPRPTCWTY